MSAPLAPPTGTGRLAPASLWLLGGRHAAHAAKLRLHVAYAIAVELDHHLVVLDVPVAHCGDPPEGALRMGHDAAAMVDEAPTIPSGEALMLFAEGTTKLQRLVVGGVARHDAIERVARQDHSRGPRYRPPLPANVQMRGHHQLRPPREGDHERPGHVAEADQPHREDEGQHRPQPAEVSEADLQDLWRQPIRAVEDHGDGLGRARAITRLAHGAGRRDLVELEAPRLLEAQGELRDLVGQVHDVVTLS